MFIGDLEEQQGGAFEGILGPVREHSSLGLVPPPLLRDFV